MESHLQLPVSLPLAEDEIKIACDEQEVHTQQCGVDNIRNSKKHAPLVSANS
jgi:hypothetical protein